MVSKQASVIKPKPRAVCCWNLTCSDDVKRFIALVEKHPKLLARISLDRLLPEWEKLVPVTGVSAEDMASKWKRLCDKYRAELRAEMNAPAEFHSNWEFFHHMEFARNVEKKRIRARKDTPVQKPTIDVKRIKLEPSCPSSEPVQPRVLVVPAPGKPKPFNVNAISTPMVVDRPTQQPNVKTFIPIEKFRKVPKTIFTKQNIRTDLQQQTGRVNASRLQPVHRIPIPNLSFHGVMDAPDNDLDFLMIRIYPLLSTCPPNAKRFCYEKIQKFIVKLRKSVNGNSTAIDNNW
uniref:MADF domain-containing protein n=1 Tax=Anopheles minimus TaxID=112268 RepID=A0A182WEQ1_9DIPT